MSTPNQPGKDEKPQSSSAASTPPPQRPGQTARPDAESASQRPSEQTTSGRPPLPPLPPLPPRQSGTPPQQPPAARPAAEQPRTGSGQAPAGSSPQRPVPPRPPESSGQPNVRGTQAPPWQRGAAGQAAQAPQSGQTPQSGQAPQGGQPPQKPQSGTGEAPAAKAAPPAGQQREPQTNLKRPEPPKPEAGQAPTSKQAPAQSPATGQQKPAQAGATSAQTPTAATPRVSPPQAGAGASKAAPQRPAPPQKTAPPTAGQAKPAQQRDAAKAKAAAIDGPTRHIDRKTLPKDMPDLSEAKHPLPAAQPSTTGQQPKVAAASVGPQKVTAAEGDPLRATVQLRKIDPWSMLKISSVISVSLFFVWMVAVGLLYIVLDGMGVWDRLNNAFTDIVSDTGSEGLVTAGQVFGYAAIIGLVNMVLMTALATIGSFIYNMCSDLVGGLEVTLADRD